VVLLFIHAIFSLLYFRHAAAWVYVDDFFLLFPKPTSAVQFTLAIILLRAIGAPLSWKKLEFDKTIDWNGWTIHPGTMIAQLPFSNQEKINSHYSSAPITFQEKPREDHRHSTLGYFTCPPCPLPILTSLYRDLYSIPVTNYSIKPTDWESFLNLLNDCDTITTHNHPRLPVGSRV